jgi:hypothetical protein
MFAVTGLVYAFATRREPINRAAWWHSAAGSALHVMAAAYLGAHGIIGLATWA